MPTAFIIKTFTSGTSASVISKSVVSPRFAIFHEKFTPTARIRKAFTKHTQPEHSCIIQAPLSFNCQRKIVSSARGEFYGNFPSQLPPSATHLPLEPKLLQCTFIAHSYLNLPPTKRNFQENSSGKNAKNSSTPTAPIRRTHNRGIPLPK